MRLTQQQMRLTQKKRLSSQVFQQINLSDIHTIAPKQRNKVLMRPSLQRETRLIYSEI